MRENFTAVDAVNAPSLHAMTAHALEAGVVAPGSK